MKQSKTRNRFGIKTQDITTAYSQPLAISLQEPMSKQPFGAPPVSSLSGLYTRFSSAKTIDLEAGDFLWREGDIANSVVLLREGMLEVLSAGVDSKDTVVLNELQPGAIFGELACLDGGRRSASIRASDKAVVSCLSAEDFRLLVRRNPHMLEALLIQQIAVVRRLTALVVQHYRRGIIDRLTGLYNHGFFVQRLALELQRSKQMQDPVSLVMIDVDFFKQFNDRYGHESGNDALARLAQIVKSVARRGDVIARYGGEEFIALLYGSTREEADMFAERVRSKVESSDFASDDKQSSRRLTLSAGVACYPEDAAEPHALILAADSRLYLAKQQGRNRVVATDPIVQP
ncbi:MAG: hypothetical protein N838_16200 [Thiohalocapsa sp. PB-PSB1]|jgi:diguanylate cyclase (GGDEF)-like protein|nr:MAG: hypothetical protein N838_16200 [Thiohalocapsa sp. PB-PSB1]